MTNKKKLLTDEDLQRYIDRGDSVFILHLSSNSHIHPTKTGLLNDTDLIYVGGLCSNVMNVWSKNKKSHIRFSIVNKSFNTEWWQMKLYSSLIVEISQWVLFFHLKDCGEGGVGGGNNSRIPWTTSLTRAKVSWFLTTYQRL